MTEACGRREGREEGREGEYLCSPAWGDRFWTCLRPHQLLPGQTLASHDGFCWVGPLLACGGGGGGNAWVGLLLPTRSPSCVNGAPHVWVWSLLLSWGSFSKSAGTPHTQLEHLMYLKVGPCSVSRNLACSPCYLDMVPSDWLILSLILA